MAAPMLLASKQTLTKLATKEKKQKKDIVKFRRILCTKLDEWPRPGSEVQEAILSKLTECFSQNSTNIVKSSKGDDKGDERTKIRAQLVIGVNCVVRAIEKNHVTCVLVSGQATPAISVNHVISLAQESGVPLLCVDQLGPTIAKSTSSKLTPLALGFKHLPDDEPSFFSDVISLVLSNSNMSPRPPSTPSLSTPKPLEPVPGKDALWPLCFDDDSEKELLQTLISIFKDAGRAEVKHDSQKKNKKKKKNVRHKLHDLSKPFSHQFEIGKRGVTHFVENGKIQIILVTRQLSTFLAAESSTNRSTSLMGIATRKKCPVICLTEMVDVLQPFFEGKVNFLGLKKWSAMEGSSLQHFQPVVDAIKKKLEAGKLVPSVPDSYTPKESGEVTEEAEEVTIDVEKVTRDAEEVTRDNDLPSDTVCKEDSESDMEEEEEEEDYSYLYVMKKDSKELSERLQKEKSEAEKSKKDLNFSTDFISLSGGSQKSSKTPNKISKSVKSNLSGQQQFLSSTPKAFLMTTQSLANKVEVEKELSKGRKNENIKLTSSSIQNQAISETKSDGFLAISFPKATEKVNEEKNSGFLSISSSSDGKETQKLSETGCQGEAKEENVALTNSLKKVNSPEKRETGKNNDWFLGFSVSKTIESKEMSTEKNEDDISLGPQSFSLDRAGWGGNTGRREGTVMKDLAYTRTVSEVVGTPASQGQKRKLDSDLNVERNILGDVSADCTIKTEDLYLPHSSSKKGKKNQKNKSEKDSSFISLTYNELNIQTLVKNVNKKKKKKKK